MKSLILTPLSLLLNGCDHNKIYTLTFSGQTKILQLFFTRSCVDENQICKGIPLCDNKNDLKWCKNATFWNEPADWKPMKDHSACTLTSQTDGVVPHSQLVKTFLVDDGTYHCLNRADEHFIFEKRQNGTNNATDWLQLVTTPCVSDTDRRCLGRNPDQCVSLRGKY